MKNKLPLYLENLELPIDKDKSNRMYSFGYIDFMYIISLVVTCLSIILVLLLRK